MKIAVWIIAIVEVVRALQNAIQLVISAKCNSDRQMKRATDALIQSFNKTDEEYIEALKSRLGDAIYPQDFESMKNLIDDVAKEQKE